MMFIQRLMKKDINVSVKAANKILYVVYTVRNEAGDDEIYRIISARLAEPDEKEIYEREKYNSGYFE